MGYGVKVDYRTGRELDLDKTYHNIIKPAVEQCGLECRRADEVRHSGIIDVPMYEWLVNANVVIADLSTYNPNAFYELGVRHAVRPHTTIVISENRLEPPFDVNHTVIRQYEHLGKDIGYSEVMRFRTELQTAIHDILAAPRIDSPVYCNLPDLQPPRFSAGTTFVTSTPGPKDTLSTIIQLAKVAMGENNFLRAVSLFEDAKKIDPSDSYILQKLVLCTYKSEYPSKLEALRRAQIMLADLAPDSSTDTETLGLAGAVHKRLWEETQDIVELSDAINYYERGFHIKNDYYNGINVAFLLNVRADIIGGVEAVADGVLASRIRREVVHICNRLMVDGFSERGDQYWIIATLREAYFGLMDIEKFDEMGKLAAALNPAQWESRTTKEQIKKLGLLLAKNGVPGSSKGGKCLL
jgi:tetratricopeptide (TPR) repeat protein